MLCKGFYKEIVVEIMLWKFFWNNQKHHVMENHVRRGLATTDEIFL